MNVEINVTSRQVGKTTKCIELLYENPSAIMFVLNYRTKQDIIYKHPDLRNRVFAYREINNYFHGKTMDFVILDEYFFYNDKKDFYSTIIPQFNDLSRVIIYTSDNAIAQYDISYIMELENNPKSNWCISNLDELHDEVKYSFMLHPNAKINKITSTDFISKYRSSTKRMTMNEIESKLGHKVEIINE